MTMVSQRQASCWIVRVSRSVGMLWRSNVVDHTSGEASRRPEKKTFPTPTCCRLPMAWFLTLPFSLLPRPLFRFHNYYYYYDYYRLLKDVPHHELQLPVEVVDAHRVLETTFCNFTRMILPAFKLVLQRCWLLP